MNQSEKIDRKLLKKSIEEFDFHFLKENNNRIIFSAPFGTGKTTFIKEFFETQRDYLPIHLFPINYSVASNEDIFQLIKFDILFQILGTDIDFESLEFTHLEVLSIYFPEKVENIFEGIMSFIPKTGNELIGTVKPLYKLFKSYSEFHSRIKNRSDVKEIKDFINQFKFEKGSIYEEDLITLLIKDLLSRHPKPILVIDDIDRLDPEHIFRILNIFSAHFDHYGNENKFEFVKVILVCDIDNIRAIFRHKYGASTDFSGYIDKFYSKEVYDFTNRYSLIGWLKGVVKNVNPSNRSVIASNDIGFISDILSLMISEKKVNFRSLNKLSYNELEILFEKLYEGTSNKRFFDLHLTKVGYILKSLFGDLKSMLEKINEMHVIQTNKSTLSIWEDGGKAGEFYNRYLFPVITYKEHQFGRIIKINYEYEPTKLPTITMDVITENHYLVVNALNHGRANKNFWKDFGKALLILAEVNAI